MKTNNLVSDILRGPWLVNPASVQQYEKLANLYLSGRNVYPDYGIGSEIKIK